MRYKLTLIILSLILFNVSENSQASRASFGGRNLFRYSTMSHNYLREGQNTMMVQKLSLKESQNFIKIGQEQFPKKLKKFPELWKPSLNQNEAYVAQLSRFIGNKESVYLGILKGQKTQAFAVGRYVIPPEVYDPGLTLLLPEFHVKGDRELWNSAGLELFRAIQADALQRNATQMVIPNDSCHGRYFRTFMKSQNFNVCSQWMGGLLQRKTQPANCEPMKESDVEEVVSLSQQKRSSYERVQPLFWKRHPLAEQIQYDYIKGLLGQDQVLAFVKRDHKGIQGAIIGESRHPGALYDGINLCSVDDFVVRSPDLWQVVGHELLQVTYEQANLKQSHALWVVTGAHDLLKRRLLLNIGLTQRSEWWTGSVVGEKI